VRDRIGAAWHDNDPREDTMLTRHGAELLLDLVDNRLSSMALIDDEDERTRDMLRKLRRELSAALAAPAADPRRDGHARLH
jgi:hypothetical protein